MIPLKYQNWKYLYLYSIKLLGVLNTNLENTYKCRCKTSVRGIGMLYKGKFLLNQKCLKDIYHAFIHSHLSAELVLIQMNQKHYVINKNMGLEFYSMKTERYTQEHS